MRKPQLKNSNINWIGGVSTAIIKQAVEDYQTYNKRLNRMSKKLRKQKKLQVDIKEQRKTRKRMKRMREEIKNIIQFFNSDWYFFLTNVSKSKMKEIIKDEYVNVWKLSRKSYGYLCLEEKLRRKGV